jgi:opacity protein-like surface antigen
MSFLSVSAKVLTASLVLASVTSLAFAKGYKGENYKGEAVAPCPPPAMLKDGWYLGAQVGYDSYRVRNSFAVPGVFATSGAAAVNGWLGGLYLGYGQYMTNMFYLGGEVFGNVSGAQQSQNVSFGVSTATTKATVNGNYGLALVPGLRLNDTSLGYIKLGWNWANIKQQASSAGAVVTSTSKTNTSNGFDLGLGIETLIVDNWSVRSEFNHTWFSSFSNGGVTTNASDNQYTVGVSYHFA